MYERLTVPALDDVKIRAVKQFELATIDQEKLNEIKSKIDCENLKHLQIQIDHIEKTEFVQVILKFWKKNQWN